jgi:thioredoxin reductase (NADPH)
MENSTHKLVIIGSGPAGLTAAIYSARAGLKPVVVGGLTFGGQLMLTTEVENFPGFPKGILGPELMKNMIEQAERFGAKIIYEDAVKVDFSKKPFKTYTANQSLESEAVIVATGASSLWLGIPSEVKLRGKGVSSCATCDAFFFKDKTVVVIGGGDSAMEEASYLTKFANKVMVLNRTDKLKASKIMQDRALNNPKVEVIYNTEIHNFEGEERLQKVLVKDNKTGEIREIEAQGAFVAIGHRPNTELFKGQVKLDDKGHIEALNNTFTSVEGVFVAGDVRDYRYRQAITASAMGCMAAMDAEKYLEGH